jgi:plastocyanin
MSKSKRQRRRARERRQERPEGARPVPDAEAEERPQAAPAAERRARPAKKRPRRHAGRRLRVSPWLAVVPLLAAGVAVVAFLVLSGGSSGGDSAPPEATPDPRVAGLTPNVTIDIEASDRGAGAEDSFYNPTEVEAKAGDVIDFVVTNTGTVTHNLRLSGPNGVYDVDTSGKKGDDFEMPPNVIKPGETQHLVVKIDAPGSYPFRCDFHPQYQKGTLVLTES